MRHFSSEDGLPSSNTYRVHQDQKGYIWIATDKGVCKFDGYDFKVFTVEDGLVSNDSWGLSEDKKGRIWLNTHEEFVYIENDKVQVFNKPPGISSTGLVNHYIFDDGNLHFIETETTTFTTQLFQLLDNDSLTQIEPLNKNKEVPPDIKLGAIKYLSVDKEGTRWYLEYANGWKYFKVYREENDLIEFFQKVNLSPGDGMKMNHPLSAAHHQNAVLFFTEKSIYIFNYQSVKKVTLKELFGKNAGIKSVTLFGESKLLLVSKEGAKVLNFDLKVLPGYDFLNGLPINSAFEDKGKNLWLCTSGGVYFLTAYARNSHTINISNDVNQNEITALNFDHTGRLWIGNSTGNLYRLNDDFSLNQMTLSFGGLTYSKGIFNIYPRKNKSMVVSGNNGLLIIKEEEFDDPIVYKKPLINTDFEHQIRASNSSMYLPYSVKTFVEQDENSMVFGASRGVSFISNDTFIKPLTSNHTRVYALTYDQSGNLWIGRKSGLYLFPKDSFQNKTEIFMDFSKPITYLQTGKNDEIWVATDGFGLYRYWKNEYVNIPEVRGTVIEHIFIDKQDRIWLSTNLGIRKIVISNNNPLTYDIQTISIAQGLASNEVNKVIVKDNLIYVGSKAGLTVLNEKDLNTAYEKPIVHFKKVSVNGQGVSQDTLLNLKHFQNNIRIGFIGLSFKSAGNITYLHQLEGIDTSWHQNTSLEQEYPYLPPGKYVFRVKAQDIDGLLSEEKRLHFEIFPPWWKTTLARLLGAVLLVSFIIGIIKWRTFIIQQKAEEQTEINKKFAELELRALQSQMNPHFVFNALQAIQDFILSKSDLRASEFLVKFSRLMRLFLESSKERYIQLSEELQLLELYIELEKLRFEDKFEFSIILADYIDPETIDIPSMIIQPFVENAINHGLVYKKTGGLLELSFTMQDNWLQISVKDNGIGRAQSKALKSKSFESYKSRGMELIKERQQILNFVENSNISIEVKDLVNSMGKSAGTEVIIIIPAEF